MGGYGGGGVIGGAVYNQSGSPRGDVVFSNGIISGQAVNADMDIYDNGGTQGSAAGTYVSGGTYSLPVSLPTGGIQIDFARPSGGALLSIWAVDAELLSKIYGTAAIVVSLLIVLAAIKFWTSPSTNKGFTARRIAGYVILLAVSVIVLGIVGCIGAVILIGLLEIARRGFAI